MQKILSGRPVWLLIFFFISLISLNQAVRLKTALSSTASTPPGRVLGALEVNSVFPSKPPALGGDLPLSQKKLIVPEKLSSAPEFKLDAAAGLAYDLNTKTVLYEHNADAPQTIASLTKIATALTFLENDSDWNSIYKIKPEDIVSGGRAYLRPGDEVRQSDLFRLALIASANSAAMSLARSTGLSDEAFVAEMNRLARENGLNLTVFVDPVGLGSGNVSTAREAAWLLDLALSKPEIAEALSLKKYELSVNDRRVIAESTDYFFTNPKASMPAGALLKAGKTGYTEAAGYCFAAQMTLKSRWSIITVVLGASSHYERFKQTADMAGWLLSAYNWPPPPLAIK